MPRFATKITLSELQDICQKHLKIGTEDFDPYESILEDPVITKDLAKVQFDWENSTFEQGEGFCKYPCGYEVLSNGLPVLFGNAGGDWEIPICFCIYYDGKKLRAYIPEDGNLFNKKTKAAYGNAETRQEEEKEEKIFQDETLVGDAEKIRTDVMKRIQIK